MRRSLQHILDLDDFERAAKPKLQDAVYGYVAHGTETETTLRGNRAAFDAWRLVTRVLVGVAERRQDIQLFGRRYAAPFGIAPMGGSALVAYEGYSVMAGAAAEARIPFVLSANSVAEAAALSVQGARASGDNGFKLKLLPRVVEQASLTAGGEA